MTHALKSLAPAVLGVALFAIGGMTPAAAATNQAILNVSAAVTNNCDVLTQPATLTMYFNPVQLIATPGTSSFTYACTNGASVSVTPTSPNVGAPPPQWIAQNSNQYDLLTTCFSTTSCARATSCRTAQARALAPARVRRRLITSARSPTMTRVFPGGRVLIRTPSPSRSTSDRNTTAAGAMRYAFRRSITAFIAIGFGLYLTGSARAGKSTSRRSRSLFDIARTRRANHDPQSFRPALAHSSLSIHLDRRRR